MSTLLWAVRELKGNDALLQPRPRPQQRARSQCGQPAAAATVLSYDQVTANQMLRPRLVCSRIGQHAR
jgi:hypothetical protein